MRRAFPPITLLLFLTTLAVGAEGSELKTAELKGQSVFTIIEAYRSAGYKIYYSSGLIPQGLTVNHSIRSEEPLIRLRELLAPLGLSLRPTTAGDAYLIVKAKPNKANSHLIVCLRDSTQRVTEALVTTTFGRELLTSSAGGVVLQENEKIASIEHPNLGALSDPPPRYDGSCTHFVDSRDVIEEVVVSSSRYRLNRTQSSQSLIDSEQLANTVELGGDAMRIVNRLPGVSSVGVSAKPHIRGGNQDELLVLFNDIELIDPFHLKDFQSIFSGLNPAVVDAIDIYTGGFPARYGNRMSGVMDVTSTTNTAGFGAEVGLSAYATHLTARDSFSKAKGSWIAAVRRGNLDWVTRRVNPEAGEPSYYDVYGLVDYTTDSGREIQFGWLTYSDDVTLNSLDEGEGRTARSLYDNHYFWAHVGYQIGALNSRTLLSFATIDNERSGTLNDPNPDEGVGFLDDDRHHKLLRLHQKFDAELTAQQQLEMGIGIEYQDASYKYRLDANLGELAGLLGRERRVSRNIDVSPEGSAYHIYASHQWIMSDKWIVESGLRWDYQDYYFESAEHQVSPRLNVLYDRDDNTKWRLSAGKFYQPEAIHELQLEGESLRFEKSQFSEQIVLGLEQAFGASWELRLEAYYKRTKRAKRRFENLFNPYILIPELSPDRIEVQAEEVRARGIEFNLTYDGDLVNAWIGGTLASADDRLEDLGWTARAWDQRTTLNSGIQLTRDRWSFSAAITWHSGWKTSTVPQSIVTDINSPLPVSRNQRELPNYFSFDLRYAYRWIWERQTLEVFAELTNATDRKNIGAVESELEPLSNGNFQFTMEEENLFPRVPSIGFVWRFN